MPAVVLKDGGDGGAGGGVVLGRRREAELLQHAADEVLLGCRPLAAARRKLVGAVFAASRRTRVA
jgi:hypothetical protein